MPNEALNFAVAAGLFIIGLVVWLKRKLNGRLER